MDQFTEEGVLSVVHRLSVLLHLDVDTILDGVHNFPSVPRYPRAASVERDGEEDALHLLGIVVDAFVDIRVIHGVDLPGKGSVEVNGYGDPVSTAHGIHT